MKRITWLFLTVTTLIFFSSDVYSCSWQPSYRMGSLFAPDDYVVSTIALVTDDMNMHTIPRDEFLFLYPFWVEHKESLNDLWNISYKLSYKSYEGDYPNYIRKYEIVHQETLTNKPDIESFEEAIAQQKWTNARNAAKKIINQIIDMPASQAQLHNDALKRALEFWELEPYINGIPGAVVKGFFLKDQNLVVTNLPKVFREALLIRNMKREEIKAFPIQNLHGARAASLQFVVLQEAMKQQIPNGWPFEISKKVPMETWGSLEGLIDNWLKQFPNHPLADLVQLMKVRVYYFKGDEKSAWNVLLKMYPEHLPRVLVEMRHLILHFGYGDRYVEEIVDDENIDPVVRTALLPYVSYINYAKSSKKLLPKPELWDKLWELSEINQTQPWAINLQERLLYAASVYDALQFSALTKYPSKPRNPTLLWGQLRLATLIKHEQWDKAWEQAISLPEDDVAILKARYYILHGNAWEAVKIKALPWDAKRYLIDVLLTTDELKKILPVEDKKVESEIVLTLALHRASAGDWDSAISLVKRVEPEKAKLWAKCAELYKNNTQEGLLRLARFLKENDGTIFYGSNVDWYRTISSIFVYPSEKLCQKWTGQYEKNVISWHLTNSSELWRALQLYITYLSKALPSPKALAVLKEADECYNKLIVNDRDWMGYEAPLFWTNYFKSNQLIAQLRKDGVRLRKNKKEKELRK